LTSALKLPEPAPGEAAIARAIGGFFDANYYMSRYPDVAAAGIDPLRHFTLHGAQEQRDPNRWFDSAWYAGHYADVGASGLNPLLHYMQFGAAELRNPHPRFDAVWYVDQHPEAAANPLLYHLRVGMGRGWLTEKPINLRDYLPSARPPLAPPNAITVDVIIPVYRGLDQTRRCIESVLSDTERLPGRVIVVDDCSPEPELSAWLGRMARSGRIMLERNRTNKGFVASVNRGMTLSATSDVALLNSDTEVPAGWLARLAAHAHSAPRIASVSPFSNNATICSYPSNAGGPVPFGASLGRVDGICRTVNAARSVDVPTTVGFCMYIRRDALNDIGLFDEKAFGRGYGEENDFCLRAGIRGWRHVLACDTFVYHEGSVSFGEAAVGLSARGLDVLAARYPNYRHQIARHVAVDGAGPFRFATTAALFASSGLPTILMVSHDLGGGVRRHIDTLAERLAGRANVFLLEETARGAALTVPGVPGHAVVTMPAERLDDMVRILRSAAVSRVHIHHLMGMDMDVRAVVQRLDIPFDVTVHDYFTICPQVNMLPRSYGPYCGEPGPAACNACIADRPSHGARDIVSWRQSHAWLFLDADRVFCPSNDLRERLDRYGFAGRALVVPHEPVAAGPWKVVVPQLRRDPLRIAVLGVLANHKGALVVAALAARARELGLELHLIGHTEEDFPPEAAKSIHVTGEYQEADLQGLIAKVQPHVLWFPAPWPETFSYTLSAGITAGLPIVASRIGAFAERLDGRPFTWLVEPTVATEKWAEAFGAVRVALQSHRKGAPHPVRPGIEDYYAKVYLQPAMASIASNSAEKTRLCIRGAKPARRRIVVIPERLNNGALSPCAYIRLLLPLDHPAIGDGFQVVIANEKTALSGAADIIVTQRYGISDVAAADALAAHARRTGARLVYDLDDDLLNIPRTHPDAKELRPKAKVVQRMIRHADTVWVSTVGLAASVAPLRQDTPVIIPNGLDERLWADRPEQIAGERNVRTRESALRNKEPERFHFYSHAGNAPAARQRRGGPVRILCMGTATHDADFAIVQPALERLKAEFKDWVTIDIMGVTRGELPGWANRPAMPPHASASYPGFVNWITQQEGWDIGLAPLADDSFNRCKSSIKTLDYSALGMAVVASDIAVYRGSVADGPGGFLVPNTADAWHAALSQLVRDSDTRRRLGAAAVDGFSRIGTLASQAGTRRQVLLDLSVREARPAKAGRRIPALA
jgi:GT2 family glycosyltransferase/glycosyltransferase involved in cell wall biosynthesis